MLNKDIWIPFLQGVNEDIDSLYINVHASDFYWVTAGSKGRVMNFKEYDEDSRMVMGNRRQKGIKSKMDVRFLERNIKGSFASEKCIFQFTSLSKDKEPRTSYGLAQVFSRLEGGRWKIYLQYVYSEPGTLQLFEQAIPL